MLSLCAGIFGDIVPNRSVGIVSLCAQKYLHIGTLRFTDVYWYHTIHLGTVSRWICMDMYGYEWICGYVMDKCHGYMDTWISCFSSGVYLSKKTVYLSKPSYP